MDNGAVFEVLVDVCGNLLDCPVVPEANGYPGRIGCKTEDIKARFRVQFRLTTDLRGTERSDKAFIILNGIIFRGLAEDIGEKRTTLFSLQIGARAREKPLAASPMISGTSATRPEVKASVALSVTRRPSML